MHGENPASPSDNRYAVSPATASQAVTTEDSRDRSRA